MYIRILSPSPKTVVVMKMDDRALRIYELFRDVELLVPVNKDNINNYIIHADQVFGNGRGDRFYGIVGRKLRKRNKEGGREYIIMVPSITGLLDNNIKFCEFGIVFNTKNEFNLGVDLFLEGDYLQVGSGLLKVDKHRRMSWTILITPSCGNLVVLLKGLKGPDSILVPSVLTNLKFEGVAIVAGTCGYCGREEKMPDFLIPEPRIVYNPSSTVAGGQCLNFYAEGRDDGDLFRTGFAPPTFRVKSAKMNSSTLVVP